MIQCNYSAKIPISESDHMGNLAIKGSVAFVNEMKHQRWEPSALLYTLASYYYNLKPKEYFIGYSNLVSWINIAGAMKMVHVNDVSVREVKRVNNTNWYNMGIYIYIYIYIYISRARGEWK